MNLKVRVSILSIVDQRYTWSPAILCCSQYPHLHLMNAPDQERVRKWMCVFFLWVCSFLPPFSLPFFLKKNKSTWSSLKDDPSNSFHFLWKLLLLYQLLQVLFKFSTTTLKFVSYKNKLWISKMLDNVNHS